MNDNTIRNNVVLFFIAGVVCLLSMLFVSKMNIDEYVKLISTVSLVCIFFFIGMYFAVRVFYLCLKKA